MSNQYETIRYERQGVIATITLDRPDAVNALSETMKKELLLAFKQVTKDRDVRCVVITGEGKAFSAGQDLLGVSEDANYADILRETYHPMMKALKQVPQPVVAAVNGVAAGAGMSLALACDFRLVQRDASFVSAFLNIGLVPDFGMMYSLPRLVGYAKALEITVLGKPIDSEKAVDLGLATEMIDKENWEIEVGEFAQRLASIPTTSISLIKRYMMDSMNEPLDKLLEKEADAQQVAGNSADHKEGVQAFLEKRKPNFTGK